MKSTKQQLAGTVFANLASKEPVYLLSDFITFKGHVFARKLFDSFLFNDEQSSQLGIFNPVYLLGSSGSGKTHLMAGMAIELRKASHKVLYSTCENFTGSIIQAIRSECLYEFQRELRSCSVLMIDEVAALSDKWRIQEEFFHAFNTLRTGGQQIILSSQTPPHKLSGIDNRLISRFEWGLLVPIESSTNEEYCAYVSSLASKYHLEADESILLQTKKYFENNFSTLNSWMTSLIHNDHSVITQEIIENLSKEKSIFVLNNSINEETIVKAVIEYFQISKEEILGKSQRQKIVSARRITMYLLRTKLQMSLNKIGRFFSQDNTTVSVACKILEKKRKENPLINEQIFAIEQLIVEQMNNASE